MAIFFKGARISETAGGRASSPSHPTLTVLDSGFINPQTPSPGGALSFASTSPPKSPSRRPASRIPMLSNDPSPQPNPLQRTPLPPVPIGGHLRLYATSRRTPGSYKWYLDTNWSSTLIHPLANPDKFNLL